MNPELEKIKKKWMLDIVEGHAESAVEEALQEAVSKFANDAEDLFDRETRDTTIRVCLIKKDWQSLRKRWKI